MVKIHSLRKVQEIISGSVQQLPGESVVLTDGLHRTLFSDVEAIISRPSFDESTRDGYVVSLSGEQRNGIERFKIVGEIPAGLVYGNGLQPGTACRIMTGGCVPEGGDRVIPHENCKEQNGELVVAEHVLQSASYIREAGSEIAQGDILVQSGVDLQPMHLALLSLSGVCSILVSRRPSVGLLCTGSELRSLSSGIKEGQKISSNTFLLQGLSVLSGACSENLGIVEDNQSVILDSFIRAKERGLDLLISTGGTGPGRYDLVRNAFVEAGGQVILTALDMRPGKSLLFGTLGRTLFFGLPGPPPAVQTLFEMLVGPTLRAMQGREVSWPQKVQALVQHRIKVKQSDVPRLKNGVLVVDRGRCTVRFPGRLEISNCYIMFQPGQAYYSEGELVDVFVI